MPISGGTSPQAPGTGTGTTTAATDIPPYPVRQDVNKMFRARCWAELNQGLVRGATVKLRVYHEEVFMRLWRQLRFQSDNFHKVGEFLPFQSPHTSLPFLNILSPPPPPPHTHTHTNTFTIPSGLLFDVNRRTTAQP